MASSSWVQAIKTSFVESLGDIVFGMEDGTVSIFGLVFGVAASVDSSAVVLLAGATGAIAAAISMMAGAYLDATSTRQIARWRIHQERHEQRDRPGEERHETVRMLEAAGFTPATTEQVVHALETTPGAMETFHVAFELKLGDTAEISPVAHAVWMFLADAIAASIPVIPFAIFSLTTARPVSIAVTAILLILLGIGRAVFAHTKVVTTVLQTLGVAAAAAIAGLLIGNLISRSTHT
jgi:vacuolar iron transporter family protein